MPVLITRRRNHARAAGFSLRGAPNHPNFAACLLASALATMVMTSVTYPQTETIRVELKLHTGGAISGLVVDHSEHGLVIINQDTPYVFAWNELKAGSAFAARRALAVFERGGADSLSAEDHLQLGLFALRHDRKDLAASEFRRAKKLDPDYQAIIKKAYDEYRRCKEASIAQGDSLLEDSPVGTADTMRQAGLAERVEAELDRGTKAVVAPVPSAKSREKVLDVYKTFGKKVQEVIGEAIVLVESDHFLIWTDWEARYRDRLVGWCESMYAALCAQFDLDPADNIFLAKCPVFCWRSKTRFLRFAREFDGYGGKDAVGYTRSIERNGHVHVVLLRQGRSRADFDRFACTLVHEGTHAFIHRLYASRLIPHWVNEGYADLTAERVLKDRCPAGENAELLARQFVRYDWPITALLKGAGPIPVHQYALAHSVVAHLEGSGHERFAGFIKDLKTGEPVPAALAANYDGLTLDQLEANWRSAVREADPATEPPSDGSKMLLRSTGR